MKFFDSIRRNIKERRARFVLLLCTAILIALTGAVFKTPAFRIVPLFISLFIMLYQSEANRYAYLASSINSIIYSIVYYSMGIYASAASSLFFSFPTSIVIFLSWSKRAHKKTVKFRKMGTKSRIITLSLCLISWLVLFLILRLTGSSYAILDNTSTILGILVTLLTSLAYIEYSYVGIVHILVALALKVQLTANDISNIPFLIYTLYNAICYVQIFINVRRLYAEQNIE